MCVWVWVSVWVGGWMCVSGLSVRVWGGGGGRERTGEYEQWSSCSKLLCTRLHSYLLFHCLPITTYSPLVFTHFLTGLLLPNAIFWSPPPPIIPPSPPSPHSYIITFCLLPLPSYPLPHPTSIYYAPPPLCHPLLSSPLLIPSPTFLLPSSFYSFS